MTKILFLLVLFVSNAIQAVTGFAGTVLAMPPSIHLLGMDTAKVVLNAMALISGFLIAVSGYKKINKKELIKIVLLMLIGMGCGMKICVLVSSDRILMLIYGICILFIAFQNLFFPGRKNIPSWGLIFVLLLAGILHGMFVSGGALLVVYAAQVLKEKEEFRATVAPVWVILNSMLLVTQCRQGLYTQENILWILIGIPPLFLATWIGGKLVKKVSQKAFLQLTYILLIISGISLIV